MSQAADPKSVVYDIFQSVKVSSVRNKSLKLFLLNLNYFLGFHKFAMRTFEMFSGVLLPGCWRLAGVVLPID